MRKDFKKYAKRIGIILLFGITMTTFVAGVSASILVFGALASTPSETEIEQAELYDKLQAEKERQRVAAEQAAYFNARIEDIRKDTGIEIEKFQSSSVFLSGIVNSEMNDDKHKKLTAYLYELWNDKGDNKEIGAQVIGTMSFLSTSNYDKK